MMGHDRRSGRVTRRKVVGVIVAPTPDFMSYVVGPALGGGELFRTKRRLEIAQALFLRTACH
jgi:hypothetical protein